MIIKYAVGYERVSTSLQTDNFSLDSQKDIIHKKADKEGYVIKHDFIEKGESAKTTDRPELQKLLKYCTDKNNNISAVPIYKWDRLCRNQLDFLLIRRDLSKFGVSLISATETNGETAEAIFMQNILGAASQYENDIKSARVKDGMKRRFTDGYTNSYPPLGYKKGIVNGKSCGIPDEKVFFKLKNLWQRIDKEKLTLGMACKELDKLQIHDKPFIKQSVSKIFSNKYYMGIITSKVHGEAKGKHLAMIDEELFYRVREQITGRKQVKDTVRRDIRDDFPLRGILLCAICMSRLTGAPSRSKSGKKYNYYVCGSRKHKAFSVPVQKADDAFIQLLKDICVKDKPMQIFTEMLKEKYELQLSELSKSSDKVNADIKQTEEILHTLKMKHLKGIYTDEEYLQMKDELSLDLSVKKGLSNEKQMDQIDIDTLLHWMHYYLTHLDEVWSKASIEGKHAIQSSIFPQKLIFVNGSYQTPHLGFIYNLKEQIESKNIDKYSRRDSNPQPNR